MVYHTLTWVCWLAAAAYLALVNQQPLQSVVLILAVATVFDLTSRHNSQGQSWGAFLRLGLWVWLVALAFNLLSVHAGNRVILTLPRSWPIIGGSITVEALLYGLANGASLFAVLLVFATFNLAVETHRLLRWMPAGLYQAGLIASIALAFVPQMVASFQDIREAQRVRGHQFRGLRDLIPLLVPLVTTALERSLALAESMEARGFGGVAHARVMRGQRLLHVTSLAALLALLTGIMLRIAKSQGTGPGLFWLGLGTLLTAAALILQGRRFRRAHYRREAWQMRDTLVSLTSLASMLMVAMTQARNAEALVYYPYPPLSPWPRFALGVGLAAALLAAPAYLSPRMTQETRHATVHDAG